jgi:hypothetical protein
MSNQMRMTKAELVKINQDLSEENERLRAEIVQIKGMAAAPIAMPSPLGELSLQQLFGGLNIKLNLDPINWAKTIQHLISLFPKTTGKIPYNHEYYCSGYYLTKPGVAFLVNSLMEKYAVGERFHKAMEIYVDDDQQNWLASTQNLLFYIYDDDKWSKCCKKNIWWILPKEEMEPINVDEDEGRISFGEYKGWLYSYTEWEDRGQELIEAVRSLFRPA